LKMSTVFYNENDPDTAEWLRGLIAAGHVANGEVDERSISEIEYHELEKYTQCHFFAGIGGWSLALRLAGWPDDAPVWTGSCPCQPFSQRGIGLAENDPRHLWPQFRRLIAQRAPSVVFGEQVASPLGRVWLDGIQDDLETLGYAFGAADLCAAGVGAPHPRQRLYWVADADSAGPQPGRQAAEANRYRDSTQPNGGASWVEHSARNGREQRWPESIGRGSVSRRGWSDFDIAHCKGGKQRRIEARTFPLAHGVPHRVGLLRGYGNAIVPELAAEFIIAAAESVRS
jgi:DNA (cytosine-5)-methyltransferase 1